MNSRNKGQANLVRFETPLLEHRRERFQESEEQRIAETAQERQKEHNRFGEEHLERSHPDTPELLHRESRLLQLVWAVDARLAVLATLLGLSVQENCCSRLGDEAKVDYLDGAADDQLHPEDPGQAQIPVNIH